MKIIFALLLIIFLAFSGYHLSFRGVRLNLPLFARQFYLTGSEFLFLGLLLGPQFLNIFDSNTQKGLAPLVALVLGWIGMLYGFQFEIAKLRKFPPGYMTAAHFEGFFTLVLVFLGTWFTLPFVIDITGPMKIPFLLLLAATSACSAQTGLVLMTPESVSRRGKTLQLLRYISSMNGLSALFVFSWIFIFHQSVSELSGIGALLQEVLFSFVASIGLLLLFMLFLSKRLPETELILVVIGMIILTSGIASVLNFSPLLTNFFVGFCLVNLSIDKERIYRILVTIEKPAYLLVLVFLGTEWRMNLPYIYLAAAVYCFYRLSGKIFSGFLVSRFIMEQGEYPPRLGYGLLEQGGLTLAILLDFEERFPGVMTIQIISLVLIGVIFNDLLSPQFFKKLLHCEQDPKSCE